MPEIIEVITPGETIVIEPLGDIVEVLHEVVEVIEVAEQGAPGRDGLGADNCLQISLRLAEFATPDAKAQARANLDLDVIDAGTFF